MTRLPWPRPRFAAAAVLGVLAALVLATGWVLGDDAALEPSTGVAVAVVVDAEPATSTLDAYRRGDVFSRPQQLPPAAAVVVGGLVAIVLGRGHRAMPRSAPALLPVRNSPHASRAPPPLLA